MLRQLFRRSRSLPFYKALFLCSLLLCFWFSTASKLTAQTPAVTQQVQHGISLYQAGQFQAAIEQWQQALEAAKTTGNLGHQAIVLENLARITQQIGQTNQSLNYWGQAAQLYQQIGDRQRFGHALIEQAQSYSRLGHYQAAIDLLCGATPCRANSAVQIMQSLQDQAGELAALGSLGETYRLRGDFTSAMPLLEQALEKARALGNTTYLIATLNSLGNTATNQAQARYQRANSATLAGDEQEAQRLQTEGLGFDRQALTYFRESIALAQSLEKPLENPLNQIRTLISAIPALYRTPDPTVAAQVQQAIALVKALPPSADKVYAILDLIPLLQPLPEGRLTAKTDCLPISAPTRTLLEAAVSTAQAIEDSRSLSFANGELGHFYECQGDFVQALRLTQAARLEAEQGLRAKDSSDLAPISIIPVWYALEHNFKAKVLCDIGVECDQPK